MIEASADSARAADSPISLPSYLHKSDQDKTRSKKLHRQGDGLPFSPTARSSVRVRLFVPGAKEPVALVANRKASRQSVQRHIAQLISSRCLPCFLYCQKAKQAALGA